MRAALGAWATHGPRLLVVLIDAIRFQLYQQAYRYIFEGGY